MQFACREVQGLFSKLPKDWLLKCSLNSNGYFRVHFIASCLQTINSDQGKMKWDFSVLTVMVSYDGQTVDGLFHSIK